MLILESIIAVSFALCVTCANAQNVVYRAIYCPQTIKNENKDTILTAVEEVPQFPGGEYKLMKFVEDNIKYPPHAMKRGIKGRVIVRFAVLKNGKVCMAKIVKGIDPDLDKEALRVVSLFPTFSPPKMDGKPVNFWYTYPINFKLPEVGKKSNIEKTKNRK